MELGLPAHHIVQDPDLVQEDVDHDHFQENPGVRLHVIV